MSAEKVIHTLLTAASAVTTVVNSRIYPAELPQNSVLPALIVSHMTSVTLPTIDAIAAYTVVQSRVEVTILTKDDYPALKSLLKKVRQACEYQYGSISGIQVISITRDLVGPDARDSDLGVFSQTIDFLVTWQDAA